MKYLSEYKYYLKEYIDFNDLDWEEEEPFKYVSFVNNWGDIYIITEELDKNVVMLFDNFKFKVPSSSFKLLTEKQMIDMKNDKYKITVVSDKPFKTEKYIYSDLIKKYPELEI